MKKEECGAIFFLCFGLFYLFASMIYDMGSLHNPQPGFFPRIMGCVMIFLSLAILTSALRKRKQAEKLSTIWEGFSRRNILSAIVIVSSVTLYLLGLNTFGFLFLSPFLMFVLAYAMGGTSWIVNIILAVGTSGLIYWVFWILMRAPIPLGSLWGR